MVPNTMLNRTPSRSSTWRTSSAGTGEPPDTATRSEDRSRRAKSGWPSMAIIMVGTPHEHRRPLGLEQLEDQGRVEGQHRHVHGQALRGAQHPHAAASRVEQRHRVHVHLARAQADPLGVEAGVVGQPAVMQFGALGEAGGAGGVLDLRDVIRRHLGQDGLIRRGGQEVRPVGEVDHLPQRRDIRPHLVQELRHRAAELRDQEDPGRAGLVQHVGQLGRPQGRVDGDQDQPGQPGRVLQDHPFGQVGRPHGHALAGGEAHGESARRLFGLGQQLSVGPAPARGRVGNPGHHGGQAGRLGGSRPQDPADRGLEHWLRYVRWPVRGHHRRHSRLPCLPR